MKKLTSALALAAAMGIPATGMAAEADFGADTHVEGFTLTNPGTEDGPNTQAYSQRTRVKMHVKGDGGASINSRVNIRSGYWYGDPVASGDSQVTGETRADPYNNEVSSNVTMDYAYVQLPVAGGILRAGRQEANWANCFLACDDRRDRILWLRNFGGTTFIALHDKRDEVNLSNQRDDGELTAAATVGTYGGWFVGVLAGRWTGNDENGYLLSGVNLFSPYVKGQVGPVGLEAGFTYMGGGKTDSNNLGLPPAFTGTHTAEFVRASWSTGPLKIEGQVAATQSGGLIAGGFDSYSMLINNNPDYNQSNTNVLNIGAGLALEDATDELDEQLLGVRGTFDVTDAIQLAGAAGYYAMENTSGTTDTDGSATFVDFMAKYMVTDNSDVYLRLGQVEGSDDVLVDSNDPNDNVTVQAATVGINASF